MGASCAIARVAGVVVWLQRGEDVRLPLASFVQAMTRRSPASLVARRAAGDRRHLPPATSCPVLAVLAAGLALCLGAPAVAQVSGAVSAESDFRLRGYSVSGGRPVGSARLGVDDESGVYADASATVVLTRNDGVRFLGYQVDAGVAKRLGGDWVIDLGIAHNQFRAAYAGGYPLTYTEGYIGTTRGPVSAYLFVSPNYYRPGFWTAYGQVEATIMPARDWRLTAHVGSLHHLYTPETYTLRHETLYDWRVAAARAFGSLELHLNVSGGGPGRQYYYGASHSRTAVVAGASLSF